MSEITPVGAAEKMTAVYRQARDEHEGRPPTYMKIGRDYFDAYYEFLPVLDRYADRVFMAQGVPTLLFKNIPAALVEPCDPMTVEAVYV